MCTAAAIGSTLLLAACGPGGDAGAGAAHPTPVQIADAPAELPVPHGKGSKTPDDFNGDGHRDLVLDALVKAQSHADDAGIGVVYGSARGITPGARQLISPVRYAARTKGRLPAVFDAEASCDLDKDGFTDLIVSTDPPYDGQGRPPVPLQVLFGSPGGLTHAVTLTVPAAARFGDDWPDQPVCGDFDGDGAEDLVLHASGERLSYLRGPFNRKGAPRASGAPVPSPGEFPTGPAADVNRDGYDDLVVRAAEGTSKASVVLGGPDGPTRTGTALPGGIDIALGRFGRGAALDAAVGAMGDTALRYDLPAATRATLASPGSMLDAADFDGDGLSELVSSGSQLRVFRGRTTGLSTAGMVTVAPPAHGTTRVLAVGDFDGDGRADLAVRTYRGETKDTIAVYRGMKKGLVATGPVVTFSSSAFLAG
ncbi:VCBS repeat-containing protein [Streptomyces sp. NBC_00847]|uniref:FG-GAP repeat domain-containing protein n=1 Tax=unclassified Streptomyces TaxID=2593676 RepID=UPI0022576B3C|nr:VCBS repeat-containing protein [Streptomyces sp. NBC_00847]MCX4882318.1 VCBS repeat-containing protein [Streptomyces sp. NBC_00847]